MTVYAIRVTPMPAVYTQAQVRSATLSEMPAFMKNLDPGANVNYDATNGLTWTSGISTYQAAIGQWVCWQTATGWQVFDEPLSVARGGYQEAADGCRFTLG